MYPPGELRERIRPALAPASSVDLLPGEALAAVLIPVLASAPEPRLVFTRRTDTLTRHPGEISFPGGIADPGEDPAAAVLREAEEELGLSPSDVELLGALEAVHTRVTQILIVPFVGMLWADPRFTPNPAEIAEVLEFPLSALASVGAEREFEWEGTSFQTYVYDMDGHVIWGATARILWSFIDLLQTTVIPERDA
jgi:8-oxo-dGTP pyrophosphatase MutT (NUDIX family)